MFSDGFESYNEDADKFHEAGFDAYCTGFCFAKMASYLCRFDIWSFSLRMFFASSKNLAVDI